MTGCVRRGRVGVTVTREKTAAIARWSVGRHQLIRALTAGGGRVGGGWWQPVQNIVAIVTPSRAGANTGCRLATVIHLT